MNKIKIFGYHASEKWNIFARHSIPSDMGKPVPCLIDAETSHAAWDVSESFSIATFLPARTEKLHSEADTQKRFFIFSDLSRENSCDAASMELRHAAQKLADAGEDDVSRC